MLCATATTINMLILFRVFQGLGGGMLMPLGMTIMTRAAGPQRMGRLMAILGVPMLLGPILGPILGGWLIENASWHWIFLINVPIGAVALVYAFVVLPNDAPQPSESFDFLGMLLLSPGLALFLFGVSSLPQENGDITAPRVWLSMLVGVAADGHVRLARVPPGAPAAGPAAVQAPQPDRVVDHDVPVRGGVLRRRCCWSPPTSRRSVASPRCRPDSWSRLRGSGP